MWITCKQKHVKRRGEKPQTQITTQPVLPLPHHPSSVVLTRQLGLAQRHHAFPTCSKRDTAFCSSKHHVVSHPCTLNGSPLTRKFLSFRQTPICLLKPCSNVKSYKYTFLTHTKAPPTQAIYVSGLITSPSFNYKALSFTTL